MVGHCGGYSEGAHKGCLLPHSHKKLNRNSAINIIIFCLSYFKFLKFSEKKTTPFVIIAYFLNLILNFSESF